jgi:hypothetical protein
MLETSYFEQGMNRASEYQGLTWLELGTLIDRLAAAPPLSSYGGAFGTHAYLSVIDRGFIFHAYFGEETGTQGTLSFELYGPYPPGTEREHGDPYDGSGLAGTMVLACLKETLALLEQHQSPVTHVRAHSVEVAVVED